MMKLLPLFILSTSMLSYSSLGAETEDSHHQGHEGPARFFDKLDKDSDGQISQQEFKTPRRKMFDRMDENGDKSVTLDEMRAAHTKMMERHKAEMEKRMSDMDSKMEERFGRMDLNKNGSVTEEEARQSMFKSLDKNEDGYVSKDEFKSRSHEGSMGGHKKGRHGEMSGKDDG